MKVRSVLRTSPVRRRLRDAHFLSFSPLPFPPPLPGGSAPWLMMKRKLPFRVVKNGPSPLPSKKNAGQSRKRGWSVPSKKWKCNQGDGCSQFFLSRLWSRNEKEKSGERIQGMIERSRSASFFFFSYALVQHPGVDKKIEVTLRQTCGALPFPSGWPGENELGGNSVINMRGRRAWRTFSLLLLLFLSLSSPVPGATVSI